jgi:hypothetical protein
VWTQTNIHSVVVSPSVRVGGLGDEAECLPYNLTQSTVAKLQEVSLRCGDVVPGSLTAQGINVKGRMGMLAELLDRCGEQELLDFFSA